MNWYESDSDHVTAWHTSANTSHGCDIKWHYHNWKTENQNNYRNNANWLAFFLTT